MASNNKQAHGCTRRWSSYNEETGNSSSQGTQSLRVEGDPVRYPGVSTSAARVQNAHSEWVWSGRFVIFSRSTFLKRIYIAQVRSIMEYGCAVWSGDNISILQKLQDRFCRENHVRLPPVQARFIYLTLLLFYKIKNKLSPMYLERLLPHWACSTSSHYHLRGHNFPVPTVRSSRALKAFLPRSIILWEWFAPGHPGTENCCVV